MQRLSMPCPALQLLTQQMTSCGDTLTPDCVGLQSASTYTSPGPDVRPATVGSAGSRVRTFPALERLWKATVLARRRLRHSGSRRRLQQPDEEEKEGEFIPPDLDESGNTDTVRITTGCLMAQAPSRCSVALSNLHCCFAAAALPPVDAAVCCRHLWKPSTLCPSPSRQGVRGVATQGVATQETSVR
jgi:hypothetical protein